MSSRIKSFYADESGAITVDWVVITAALVGLAIAATTTLGNGTHDHAERIGDKFVDEGVKTAY